MTIKSRVAQWLYGDELAEVKRINNALIDYAHYQLTPEGLIKNLGELDSHLVDMLLDLSRYEQIGGIAGGGDTENARKRAVELSRYYANDSDVLTGLAVDMWTDFGFGQDIHITPNDPTAVPVWDECWLAPRNRFVFAQDAIHEQCSRRILIDGEVFFVAYVSKQDGTTTWRTFDTDQVKQIITAKNDPAVKLWYIVDVGTNQIAFPDAFALFAFGEYFEKNALPGDIIDANAIEKNLENGGTFCAIVPAQRNIGRLGRGWPQFKKALPWAKTTSENIQNHAAVSALVATYVDKITAKGGQRAIDMIRDSLRSSLATNDSSYNDTNPAPAAGSTWLQNDQVDRTRMPLSTGARDAQVDSMVLLSMAAAGFQVPPHWLMRPDMAQNRSVAEEMAKPAIESWRRYQTFWAARFADIVETTLRFKVKFGKAQITDFTSIIQLDAPTDLKTEDLSRAMDSISGAATAATLPAQTATAANVEITKMLLGDFGLNDPSGMLEPADEDKAELSALVMTVLGNYEEGSVERLDFAAFLLNELRELARE